MPSGEQPSRDLHRPLTFSRLAGGWRGVGALLRGHRAAPGRRVAGDLRSVGTADGATGQDSAEGQRRERAPGADVATAWKPRRSPRPYPVPLTTVLDARCTIKGKSDATRTLTKGV